MPVVRVCAACRNSFSRQGTSIYCSQRCAVASRPVRGPLSGECRTCKKPFTGRPDKIYCSKKCWPSEMRGANCRPLTLAPFIPTGTIGAIAEMAVCADLLERGYAVFRSVSPSCFCDLIAKKAETSLQIEVRTGYERNGKLQFPKKRHADVDCFAVWNKETRKVIYLTTDILEKILL